MSILSKLFRSKKQDDETPLICGNCKRETKVKYFPYKMEGKRRVVIIGPDQVTQLEKENIALRCQNCGYIVCFSCASSQTGAVGIPTCPGCGEKGGPYVFTQ